MKKFKYILIIITLALIGLADASYLTYKHYDQSIPKCTIGPLAWLNDCGEVLKSDYATFGPIPLSLLGVGFYTTVLFFSIYLIIFTNSNLDKNKKIDIYPKHKILNTLYLILTTAGALASTYFIYLQLVIIKSICAYCMLSAIISYSIFLLSFKQNKPLSH